MTFFIALQLVMGSAKQTLCAKSTVLATCGRLENINFGRALKFLGKNYIISKHFYI
jgi:hypothetical protein